MRRLLAVEREKVKELIKGLFTYIMLYLVKYFLVKHCYYLVILFARDSSILAGENIVIL